MATNHQVDGTQKETMTDGMEPIQPRNEDPGMELTCIYGDMEPKNTVMGMELMGKGVVTDSTLPTPHPSH